jgi:hypothetical protein
LTQIEIANGPAVVAPVHSCSFAKLFFDRRSLFVEFVSHLSIHNHSATNAS